MKNLLNAFLKDEDGAVTVDWVVLTAAVVGIALAVVAVIKTSLTGVSSQIATGLTAAVSAGLT
jgi:Flp pilus assembly pilin Flp